MEVIIRQTLVTAGVSLVSFFIGKYVLSPGGFVGVGYINAMRTCQYMSSVYARHLAFGQTMAFLTLGWASIIHIFTARTRKSAFSIHPLKNKQMTFSALALFVALALMAAIPAINSHILGTGVTAAAYGMGNVGFGVISWQGWLIALALCFGPIMVAEYAKFWDNYKLRMIDKNRVDADHPATGFCTIDGENIEVCSKSKE